MAICASCGSNWKTSVKSIRFTLSKKPLCLCPSCRLKESWDDQRKAKQSVLSKKMLENNDIKTKISTSLSSYYLNGEAIEHSKEVAKKLWENCEYRNKIISSLKDSLESC